MADCLLWLAAKVFLLGLAVRVGVRGCSTNSPPTEGSVNHFPEFGVSHTSSIPSCRQRHKFYWADQRRVATLTWQTYYLIGLAFRRAWRSFLGVREEAYGRVAQCWASSTPPPYCTCTMSICLKESSARYAFCSVGGRKAFMRFNASSCTEPPSQDRPTTSRSSRRDGGDRCTTRQESHRGDACKKNSSTYC